MGTWVLWQVGQQMAAWVAAWVVSQCSVLAPGPFSVFATELDEGMRALSGDGPQLAEEQQMPKLAHGVRFTKAKGWTLPLGHISPVEAPGWGQ